MRTEKVRVQLGARAAALVIAALALAAMMQNALAPGTEESARAGAQSAAILIELAEQAPTQALPNVRNSAQTAHSSELAAQNAEGSVDATLRLWLNGPSGEVIFRNAEQYARCSEARMRRVEAPDCPSYTDARPMILTSS